MKRANGTGSIVKLSGKRRRPYAVKVSGRDEHGHTVQKILGYHATSRDAQAALDNYNKERAAGRGILITKMDATLQSVFDGWSTRAYKKLKQNSIYSHNAAWNNRVSRFANLKMRDITLDDWQSILDEDEDNGKSQSLINNDAVLIKALCAYAMERDIIGKDYSAFLDIPSVDPIKAKGAFNDFQMAQLERMASDGVQWADTVLMMCYTGFRISEFLGLTPLSYDWKNGCLQGGIKTEAGKNRIVPVHSKIAPYLNQWIKKGGFTIICHDDGSPIDGAWYRVGPFKSIMQEIGAEEATPHWCRHTFATRLHAAEVDELTIKWLMGHSAKKDVTAGYTHPTLDVLKPAIQKLA